MLFPYWTNDDGTQRKRTQKSQTNLENLKQDDCKRRQVIEKHVNRTKKAIPHPLILPEISILTIPYNATSKRREIRKLKRNVFPRVLVCAFSPFFHPMKRMDTMFTYPCLLTMIRCHKDSLATPTQKWECKKMGGLTVDHINIKLLKSGQQFV